MNNPILGNSNITWYDAEVVLPASFGHCLVIRKETNTTDMLIYETGKWWVGRDRFMDIDIKAWAPMPEGPQSFHLPSLEEHLQQSLRKANQAGSKTPDPLGAYKAHEFPPVDTL